MSFFPWPTFLRNYQRKKYSRTIFLLRALAFHCRALSPLWSLNANKSAEQQTLVFVSETPASLLRAVGLGRGFSISVSFQPAVCILLQNLWSMLMRTAWLPGRTAGSWQSSFGGLSSQLGLDDSFIWSGLQKLACLVIHFAPLAPLIII